MASSSDSSYSGALVPDIQAMNSGASVPRIDQFAAENPQMGDQIPTYTVDNMYAPEIQVVPWQPSSTLAAESPVDVAPSANSDKATLALMTAPRVDSMALSQNAGTTAVTPGVAAGTNGVQ